MILATKHLYENTWLNAAPDHPEHVVRFPPGICGGDPYSYFPEIRKKKE